MGNKTNHYEAESHPLWKGDSASYSAVHTWVRKHYEKPLVCEKCGEPKSLDWANVSGRYDRLNREDWVALCKSCHGVYDRPRFCKKGHEFTVENTAPHANRRKCRTCRNESWRAGYYKRLGRDIP